MAFDPTEVASNQEAQQRIVAAGAPTEFAKGPGQDGVQVAGVGRLIDMLNKLDSGVVPPKPPKVKTATAGQAGVLTPEQIAAIPEVADPMLAPRMPTPQEVGLVPDSGAFSETATKRALAGQVLSPEGVARFEAQGLQAPKLGEIAPTDVIQDAQSALADQAAEAELSAIDVNAQAKKALTAEIKGSKSETAVASEEVSDAIIDRISLKEQNLQSLKDGGDFNFDYMETEDDVKSVITAIGDIYKDETVARTRGQITNKETMRAAAAILGDEIGLTGKLLSRRIGEGGLSAEEFVASRELLVKSATRLEELAKLISLKKATAADRLKFRRQLSIHSGIQLQLKGAQTEAARALQSFQIPVSGEMTAARFDDEALRLLSESGADGVTDQLAFALLKSAKDNPKDQFKAINEFAQVGWKAKSKRMVHEAYLAGLLSSPATQVKNIVGTSSFMLFQLPAEAMAGMYGSIIRAARKPFGEAYLPISEDQVYMEDVLFRLKGWSDSFSDAMKAGSLAWRTEMPSGASKLDVEQYAATSASSNSMFQKSLDQIGKRMRIPFRLLLSADEFTKTISQRGEFYTQINRRYQHSLRKGMSEQEALDEAGMLLLDPKAVADELDYKARYDTLQSDLGMFGEVAGKMQRNLVGRFIMPFVTAPTNAVLRTAEYIGFAPSKGWSDLSGKNGVRSQQLALGRYTLGTSVLYKTSQYAMDGKITGSMPSDESSRNALPPGWQPYSFVLRGDGFPEDMPLYDTFGVPNGPLNYVSFAGFEPVGGLLAISADTAQRMNRTNDPQQWYKYIFHAGVATMDYYSEMPMLQGIADVVSLVESKDPAKFARSYAESATPIGVPNPMSSLERMFMRLADPTKVKPREDFDYYTIEDVRKIVIDENGKETWAFSLADGKPDYSVVGLPKSQAGDRTDPASYLKEFFQEMNSLQAKDSFVRQTLNDLGAPISDERDLNAVQYDTLGNVRGSDEFSFAANPGAALFSNMSGLRLKRSENLESYEKELIRLQAVTGKWPLTNPEKMGQIKLSYGMQSDLIKMAKNEIVITGAMGALNFRDTIYAITSSPSYKGVPEMAKVNLLKKINGDFLDAGFLALLEDPEYANMRKAYEQVKQLKESGRQ